MKNSYHLVPIGIHKVVNLYGIAIYSLIAQFLDEYPDESKFTKKRVQEEAPEHWTRGEFSKGWKDLHEKGFLTKKSGVFNGVRHAYWEFDPTPDHVEFVNDLF